MHNNDDFGFLIQIINRQVFRFFSNAGKSIGISSMEVNILNYFFDNKKKQLYQIDLETAFNIRSSTATANVNLMEKKGLLKRIPDPQDMRRKLLVPTKKAFVLEKELNYFKQQLDFKISNNLSSSEQKELKKMLKKIIKNLKE
ncbi:MarR family transcriptional regulator [Enterococcus entomosocium]|uniref:MarR family winged helix-turn-helix transcriptional regulator n=1 Tax=Enterococcus entomosocium TaxID=3034352 RepID=UPI003D6B299D